ncbi:hypothetical protein HNR46_003501 [Haloferula luteola]|uniref:Serine protease n=1 Tax=Haloferula luteola TaxID=595692 RepID=A0A840V867_9BACT|nr:hypothetical protein [Haloferula luteola]MBB5353246.1 hypothetical protein [Haloferula luteola]
MRVGTCASLVLVWSGLGAVSALEIRDPTSGAYVWLWGLPTDPSLNTLFEPNPGVIRQGVGWPDGPLEWHRMLALVSPVHFIGVAHYPFEETTEIRFLGEDGVERGYALSGQEVLFRDGVATDLTLGTLAEPMDFAAGVRPYAVPNLAEREDYLDRTVMVVGKAGWAGQTRYRGFEKLVGKPGFDTTEYVYFDFPYEGGAAGDLRFEGGDSGSPTLMEVEGEWCLVGVHSALEEVPEIDPVETRSYDGFLPDYADELDALMEPLGYHLRRRFPEETELGVVAQAPVVPTVGEASTVTVEVQGMGPGAAHNVTVKVAFPGVAMVSGAGWIFEKSEEEVWHGRRGGLTAGGQGPFQVMWENLPSGERLEGQVEASADGVAAEEFSWSWPLRSQAQAQYDDWAEEWGVTGFEEDPDHDGWANLLEYAMGSDPASGLGVEDTDLKVENERVLLRFPWRTDAAERGLRQEFQVAGLEGQWGESFPEGTILSREPFVPERAGFERVTISLPQQQACFIRMKVTLDE